MQLTCQRNGQLLLPSFRLAALLRICVDRSMSAIAVTISAKAIGQTMPLTHPQYAAPGTFACRTLPSEVM